MLVEIPQTVQGERQRGWGMLVRLLGKLSVNPINIPLRRENRSILVMLFINSPVTSQCYTTFLKTQTFALRHRSCRFCGCL